MSKARSFSEDNIIYEISSNFNNDYIFPEIVELDVKTTTEYKPWGSSNDPVPFVKQKAMPSPKEQVQEKPKIDLNIREILKDKPDGESIEITKFIFKFVFYKINDIYIKETYLIKDNIVNFIGYEQEKLDIS